MTGVQGFGQGPDCCETRVLTRFLAGPKSETQQNVRSVARSAFHGLMLVRSEQTLSLSALA